MLAIPPQYCLSVVKTSEPEDEQLCLCSAHIAYLLKSHRQFKQGSLATAHSNPALPNIMLSHFPLSLCGAAGVIQT